MRRLAVALLAFSSAAGIVAYHGCGGGGNNGPQIGEGSRGVMAPGAGPGGARATSWCGAPDKDPSLDFPPLTATLHVFPPLGGETGGASSADAGMIDYLKISVCDAAGAGPPEELQELASGAGNGAHDRLRLVDSRFLVDWKIPQAFVGKDLELHFLVANLELGYLRYVPVAGRTLPVKFTVDDHPRIRARLLHEQGYGAMDVARILRDDYGVSMAGTIQILTAERYDKVEIGRVLKDLFEASPEESARILKDACYTATDTAEIFRDLGYSVRVIYDVLKAVFDLSDREIELIFDFLGYDEDDYIDVTTRDTVARFAPVLYFDSASKGLPMPADAYFRNMMTPVPNDADNTITWTTPWNGPPQNAELGIISVCGRDECNNGMSNGDFSRLLNARVPTYYKVISDTHADNTGRLRIAYWWFYGFQTYCNSWDVSSDGSHHGDWEHVLVTTVPDRSRMEYVTYYFHAARYTRKETGIPIHPGTERAVVYVGKLGHGSYHSNEISGWMVGTPSHCCEYADYRNPVSGSVWANLQDNLVSLRGNAESWLSADRIGGTYEYQGKKYKVTPGWNWGPHISYCDWWLFGCMDWVHTSACGTHPTVAALDWTIGSCSGDGCGTSDCRGLVYTHKAYYNQPWPWDSAAANVTNSRSSVAGPEGTPGEAGETCGIPSGPASRAGEKASLLDPTAAARGWPSLR